MVIDSHTLVWWLENSEEISEVARDVLDHADERGEAHRVCAVTFWEIALKVRRGQMMTKFPVDRWLAILGELRWLTIEETTAEVWLKTAEMEWSHRDPADRIIAATALIHGEAVLTRDGRFHAADSPVKAVW
jgi:PIN domain nuclease of toxin-antitoxin system